MYAANKSLRSSTCPPSSSRRIKYSSSQKAVVFHRVQARGICNEQEPHSQCAHGPREGVVRMCIAEHHSHLGLYFDCSPQVRVPRPVCPPSTRVNFAEMSRGRHSDMNGDPHTSSVMEYCPGAVSDAHSIPDRPQCVGFCMCFPDRGLNLTDEPALLATLAGSSLKLYARSHRSRQIPLIHFHFARADSRGGPATSSPPSLGSRSVVEACLSRQAEGAIGARWNPLVGLGGTILKAEERRPGSCRGESDQRDRR
ncbi:hypothetical protein FA95DRAFT_926579 [Auriscalpium vulgare]|uniref:Uncharacterized protein n=1 Tax=Auriscalpium vulgare TaxID=40419 RepID=A0ACB8R7G8_9AGAM|nr:hypothetical protein FA95DRAFT_926579 [Auriscalpium vulgare]